MQREPIYQAILAQLNLLTLAPYNLNIPVISRDFKHWTDSPMQPCIYLVEEKHANKYNSGNPAIWTMTDSLWIYAKKDSDYLGVQYLNMIMDGIDSLVGSPTSGIPGRFDNNWVNTLGGLAQWCGLNGNVDISGGYLGDQAVARMTLETVVA